MIPKNRLAQALAVFTLGSTGASADQGLIYSVYQQIPMGNPGESILKDYFINMGTQQGIKTGDRMTVYRKFSTHDLTNNRIFKDVIFPFATIRIIHTEDSVAIARFESANVPEKTPLIEPNAISVGDIVVKK